MSAKVKIYKRVEITKTGRPRVRSPIFGVARPPPTFSRKSSSSATSSTRTGRHAAISRTSLPSRSGTSSTSTCTSTTSSSVCYCAPANRSLSISRASVSFKYVSSSTHTRFFRFFDLSRTDSQWTLIFLDLFLPHLFTLSFIYFLPGSPLLTATRFHACHMSCSTKTLI
jgi:hypothetical protein